MTDPRIYVPDWKEVMVILLNLELGQELPLEIPSPALAYSQWELRGFLGIPRGFCVELKAGPGEWLFLQPASLYPFKFEDGMIFRTEDVGPKLL